MICPKINWKIYSQLHRLNLWTYMQWILYKILYFQYSIYNRLLLNIL